MVIDSILRASVIAAVIEETAGTIEPEALKEMAAAMRERTLETLVLGGFDEDDVADIRKDVHASMYTRPDA